MGTQLFLRVMRCMYRLVHEIADELDKRLNIEPFERYGVGLI